MEERFIKIGLISISDRASSGEYEMKAANLKNWLTKVLIKPFNLEEEIIPDEIEVIKNTLITYRIKKNVTLFLQLVEQVLLKEMLLLKHFKCWR